MKFLVCCFVVVLLQFAASEEEEKEYYTGLIIPEKELNRDLPDGIFLLYEESVIQQASKNKDEVVVSKVEYNEPNVEIYGIKTTPLDEDTKLSKDELIEGGAGQNFAVVQVTSQPGKGNYFSVEVFGKYLNDDNVEVKAWVADETA